MKIISQLIGFHKSKNRDTYCMIGEKQHVRPFRVYQLAHGRTPKGMKEELTFGELVNDGIVVRRSRNKEE